tara:strand:+ start:298 stop:408 length:111 start_codon:yes stop_codon:yes gene_type:complete
MILPKFAPAIALNDCPSLFAAAAAAPSEASQKNEWG